MEWHVIQIENDKCFESCESHRQIIMCVCEVSHSFAIVRQVGFTFFAYAMYRFLRNCITSTSVSEARNYPANYTLFNLPNPSSEMRKHRQQTTQPKHQNREKEREREAHKSNKQWL